MGREFRRTPHRPRSKTLSRTALNRNTFAYPTTVIDPDGFSSTVQYNYDLGAKSRTQGPPPAGQLQGAIQTFTYDTAARVQQVTTTNTGAYRRYIYGPNYVQSFSTVNTVADDAYAIQVFDGVGQVIGAASNHPGSQGGYSLVNTIYDWMGRAVKQSNPGEINNSWVPVGDEAAGLFYTQQTYDWKGRPLVTTNTDGTQKYASYSACGCAGGEVVTLTDEVGRRQKIYSDVLGRNSKTEILNWDGSVYSTTTNTFNSRDQVTLVRQFQGTEGGGVYQDATMSYDGYGRLQTRHVSEQNEGTATVYVYNSDDTVQSITDARGATCTYGYNARHHVTSATHTLSGQSTIALTYGFDAAGNRTSMSDSVGSTSYNYNQLSKMTSETRTFNGLGSFTLTYGYNLAGELTIINDPFGGSLNYNYDSANRLNSVNGSGYGSESQFASGAQYRAWGGLKELSYNSYRSLSVSHDTRMRPTLFRVTSQSQTVGAEYQYYADSRISYSRDLTEPIFDRSYSYDHLGRLTSGFSGSEARGGSAPDGPYRQTYGYDTWGNLNQRTGRDWSHNSAPVSFTYDNSTNRNSQWQYDFEGNVTAQGTRQYTYDAAGKQVRTSDSGGGYINHDFDGDGFKVRQSYPGWAAYYLRSTALDGEIVVELDTQGQFTKRYIYAHGKLLAQQYYTGWVAWNHRSPNNSTEWTSVGTGAWRGNEYDPLGTRMGTEDPYLDGGSYGGWGGGSGIPSDLTTGCSWEGMAIGCQYAIKFTGWRAYTSGGLRITSRTIPGVGTHWPQTTHVRSRVVGLTDWSDGDIIDYKNFISVPDSYQTSIVRTHHVRPQNPTQFRDKYIQCAAAAGGAVPPRSAVATIQTVSQMEGVDPSLLAVTWGSEASPPFSFDSVGHPRYKNGKAIGADVGPGQIANNGVFTNSPWTDGLGNPFGTFTTQRVPFDGNPLDNLRLSARILNSYGGGSTAAGRYHSGTGDFSKKPEGIKAFNDRVKQYNQLQPSYSAFFNCMNQ